MDRPVSKKYPPTLVLTAYLSGGFTIALSLIYILLSIGYIVFRFGCDVGLATTSTGAGYFWQTIYRVYVLSSTCEEALTIESLTDGSTLLILIGVMLAISVICLVTGILLVTIVQDQGQSQYLNLVVYSYLGSWVASLVIDLTTASYFGIDYSHLTSILRTQAAGAFSNYQIDVIRQGVFWLMTIALKGYIVHVINCVLLVLLVVYTVEYQDLTKSEEHSIHKIGVLDAFDSIRKPEETWAQPEIYNSSPLSRGPVTNSAFVDDDTPPRSPRRPEPRRSDYYSNRSFDRSDSWHHSQNNGPHGARAFSYLEDIKRLGPVKTPSSPAEPQWRRDPWPQAQLPPVPAPDYSPTQPRRLKSALKPAYL